MKLVICGAGQYGMVAKEAAEAMGLFKEIYFLDDHSDKAIGKLDDLNKTIYDAAFVAIGNPEVRKHLHGQIPEEKLVRLIHPRSVVMPSAEIEPGIIIEAGAVVCSHARIGKGSIIMANAVVGHDAEVGGYCQLKYNCVITENSVVPDGTKVDCNVVWRSQAEIAQRNRSFAEEEVKKTGVEPSFF